MLNRDCMGVGQVEVEREKGENDSVNMIKVYYMHK
jgi:hypothetical protein